MTMGISDPPIWVHTALDSIPGVTVSFGSFGMGFVNFNLRLGSFDDYPHTDEMATSAASFNAYEADGSDALDFPQDIDRVALNELNIHLPSEATGDTEEGRQAAREATRDVLPEQYADQLRVTVKPLVEGAWAPHVKLEPEAREDLDHEDLRAILQHFVREHPAFDYDEGDAGEYIEKDAIDHMMAEADRLGED